MRLTLQSQTIEEEDAVVIRCSGRISAGPEVEALQAELERQTKSPGKDSPVKWVVLHLAEIEYIDSSGLGALVHMASILRAAGGGLALCQVSPFVLKVLQVTNLLGILPAHPTERAAIAAFYSRPASQNSEMSRTRIVCIDNSMDLLAYVRALLTSAGYEVHAASNLADAKRLVSAMKPQAVICGPGILALPTAEAAVESFRQRPNIRILRLPSDFSTSEAGQAGVDLVSQVQSLLAN